MSQSDLEKLHKKILGEVIPRQTTLIREPLHPHLVRYTEEGEIYTPIGVDELSVSAENPQVHYLVEVNPQKFPEFVTEFTGTPFADDLLPGQCGPKFLEKHHYNSILRASSDLIKKVQTNLANESSTFEGHNVLDFYTEFSLNNKSSVKPTSIVKGILQILFVFNVSYRDR